MLKKTLTSTLCTEDVIIPLRSVSVGQLYLQYVRPEFNRSHDPRYLVYFIASYLQLMDSIAFAYGYLLIVEVDTGANRKTTRAVGVYDQESNCVQK